jgi:hypothetical protein
MTSTEDSQHADGVQRSSGLSHTSSSDRSETATPIMTPTQMLTPTPTLHDQAPTVVTDNSAAKSGEGDAASHLQRQATESVAEANQPLSTAPDKLDNFTQDTPKASNPESRRFASVSDYFHSLRQPYGGHDKTKTAQQQQQPVWPPPRRESLTVGAPRIWVCSRTPNAGPTPQPASGARGHIPRQLQC